MAKLKSYILSFWFIENHIRLHIGFSRFFYFTVPIIGRPISMIMDRLLLLIYSIDLASGTVNVKSLSISHPSGVLLGGNGIYSEGRVVVMSGVKFGGRTPNDSEYLLKHKESRVFELGDNVVIGSNSVILGPVNVCDNVIIGSMSLVNKSIDEPGVYVGIPVKKVSDHVSDNWIAHL